MTRLVGYCPTCRWWRPWAAERPVQTRDLLARFGRCRLQMRPVVAMCEWWEARTMTISNASSATVWRSLTGEEACGEEV